MGVRATTAGVLLGAILAATEATSATFGSPPTGTIQVQIDGNTRPDLRADLLSLEVEESPQNMSVSMRVLNYRLAPSGTTPVLYYSEGPAAVALGALLRVTIDGDWHECPVTRLDAEFPVSHPPQLTIICRADRIAPRGSAPEDVISLPLVGFSASMTMAAGRSRVTGSGTLGPGWGTLRVNDMISITDAGPLSGTYRVDRVKHTFDLTHGLTTSYQGPRVRP